MNAMQEKLFLELRQTKWEIEQSLSAKQNQDWLTEILTEELNDISEALQKIQQGKFGQCEISGELIPDELLKMIPTLKSVHDAKSLGEFFKKPISTLY
ncbi:hypothetical protein [Neobacillus sp. LXY-1]|uniref:hypothetical protein n=1 Tax=Neobacillus sp. LXY-1 TaxID=3379133 RepID=UPI003EE1F2CD